MPAPPPLVMAGSTISRVGRSMFRKHQKKDASDEDDDGEGDLGCSEVPHTAEARQAKADAASNEEMRRIMTDNLTFTVHHEICEYIVSLEGPGFPCD